MEELVIELDHDPKDVKAVERLIKKNNEDRATLRKQLKLPQLTHPHTAEVIEKKSGELMDLVLNLNEQLKETEQELEKVVQSRQSESTMQPQTVVPIVSTVVPSTLETVLAPNIPLTTAAPIETTGTSQVGT